MKRNYLFSILLVILLTFITYETKTDRYVPPKLAEEVQTVTDFRYSINDEYQGEIKLPHNFENLSPRTSVTLETEILIQADDSLLLKTVYAPFRLYVNDQLCYEYGQDGTYPDFLLDPPTVTAMIPLPYTGSIQRLKIEYLSPTQRSILTIPNMSIGNEATLLTPLFKKHGIPFLFSLLLIFIGLSMSLFAGLIIREEKVTAAFLWLGLFSLATGIWGFGECDLTALFFPYPALLYILAFSGFFTILIPLLRFGILVLNLHHKMPLQITLVINKIAVIGALTLQGLGFVGLSRSMYLFHLLIPLSLIIFSACILWESIRYKNIAAKRFALPLSTITAFAMLELINYQFRFIDALSLFFQLGVLSLIISLGYIGAKFIKESLRIKAEKIRLEFEIALMERQLDVQKMQYLMLTKNAEAVKAQRHDLRHQLAVIKGYNDLGNTKSLSAYLDELINKIPVESGILCKNFAVNAVALYYLALAKSEDFEVDLKLIIPEKNAKIQDSDLCIIIGNLFENAIEACRNVAHRKPFINLYSRLQNDTLVIVADNSFDGFYDEKDGTFLSRKRNGKGTGISSVQAVTTKYNGTAKFEAQEKVFMASIYIKL